MIAQRRARREDVITSSEWNVKAKHSKKWGFGPSPNHSRCSITENGNKERNCRMSRSVHLFEKRTRNTATNHFNRLHITKWKSAHAQAMTRRIDVWALRSWINFEALFMPFRIITSKCFVGFNFQQDCKNVAVTICEDGSIHLWLAREVFSLNNSLWTSISLIYLLKRQTRCIFLCRGPINQDKRFYGSPRRSKRMRISSLGQKAVKKMFSEKINRLRLSENIPYFISSWKDSNRFYTLNWLKTCRNIMPFVDHETLVSPVIYLFIYFSEKPVAILWTICFI